jgi:unsaturated rhamnogalacturonyl hydrolase
VAALQDAGTGLFYHQYDEETGRRNGVLWARGNGWAMLGLVGCLESLPPSHPDYPVILQYFRRLAAAVIGTQDPHTSLWHTVITDAKTSHEGSASLMLSGGLMRAANAGLLEAPFGAAGARAWEQLWNAVDDDGTVRRVSARTPPRSDPGAYESRPMGDNHPWGQGAHLLASAAWLDAHGMYGAYRDTGGGSDGRS